MAVYFLRCTATGRVKIGKAKDVRDRVADIQRMSGARLEVVAVLDGYSDEETALHRKYARWRLHGEWFDLPPDAIPSSAEAPWSTIAPQVRKPGNIVGLPNMVPGGRPGGRWTQERNTLEWMHRDGLFVTESDGWGQSAWNWADHSRLLPKIFSLGKPREVGRFRCERRDPVYDKPRTLTDAEAAELAKEAARAEAARFRKSIDEVVKARVAEALRAKEARAIMRERKATAA